MMILGRRNSPRTRSGHSASRQTGGDRVCAAESLTQTLFIDSAAGAAVLSDWNGRALRARVCSGQDLFELIGHTPPQARPFFLIGTVASCAREWGKRSDG